MSRRLGYVVVEWNQAGGPAVIPFGADIHQDEEAAGTDKERYEFFTVASGRRERYDVAALILPDDDS